MYIYICKYVYIYIYIYLYLHIDIFIGLLHRARASCLPDSIPYGHDGLARSRSLSTARRALRLAEVGSLLELTVTKKRSGKRVTNFVFVGGGTAVAAPPSIVAKCVGGGSLCGGLWCSSGGVVWCLVLFLLCVCGVTCFSSHGNLQAITPTLRSARFLSAGARFPAAGARFPPTGARFLAARRPLRTRKLSTFLCGAG